MAEKYGEIPPRFTRAWWSYFWYYYKWHTLIILFAALFVVFTCVQCATKQKYDINVSYVGHKLYTDEKLELLGKLLAEHIDDADGNGENSVFVQQINFSDANGHEEYDYASQTKFDVEMQESCSFIFLLDKEILDNMLARDYVNEVFSPVSEWAENAPEEDLVYADNGTAYAVSLKDSALMNENEIYSEDTYIVIRRNYKDNEKNQLAFESSKKAANALIEK